MNARASWSQGLQWGSCAWLVYVAFRASAAAIVPLIGRTQLRFLIAWPSSAAPLMAAAWLTSLALIGAGSRWSRPVLAGAICVQAIVGVTESSRYGGPLDLSFTLRFFVPMCLPLLPIVLLPVKQPRVVLALLALGRWSEAIGRFGGHRTLLVAIALLSLNHSAYALLMDLYRGARSQSLVELTMPALLFALAAISARRGLGVSSICPGGRSAHERFPED